MSERTFWVKYDIETGRVTGYGNSETKLYEFQQTLKASNEEYALGEIESLDDYYVDEGVVLPRPKLIISITKTTISADGEDYTVMDGFPPGSEVLVSGTPYFLEDGSLELTAEVAASYEIIFTQWPYYDWSATIMARDP